MDLFFTGHLERKLATSDILTADERDFLFRNAELGALIEEAIQDGVLERFKQSSPEMQQRIVAALIVKANLGAK
jgi:hypothetical protein